MGAMGAIASTANKLCPQDAPTGILRQFLNNKMSQLTKGALISARKCTNNV